VLDRAFVLVIPQRMGCVMAARAKWNELYLDESYDVVPSGKSGHKAHVVSLMAPAPAALRRAS
jgi:hypothetical protein